MRILVVCLLLGACASPLANEPLPQSAHLAPGAVVAAPDGLSDYCVRRSEDCGANYASDLRGLMPATGAASWQNASVSHRASDTMFAAMMAARMSRANAAPVDASSSVVELTEERWAQLRRVNRDINRAIRPATDRALYGVEEYWQRPLLMGEAGARGDCEDYALEKRARLLALGYAPDALAMAVAVAPGVGLHAVLIVQTNRGDFVLDNLHGEPRALASLDYVWLTRQVGPTLAVWATARADVTVLRTPAFVDASAEARFARLMQERMLRSAGASPQAPAAAAFAPAPLRAPDWSLAETSGLRFARYSVAHETR